MPSCSSLGQGGLVLKGPLHARLFRKAYLLLHFSTVCKLTGCVKFKGLMLIFAAEKLIQKHPKPNGFGPALLRSGEREALSREEDQGQVRLHCEVRSLSSPSRLDGLGTTC